MTKQLIALAALLATSALAGPPDTFGRVTRLGQADAGTLPTPRLGGLIYDVLQGDEMISDGGVWERSVNTGGSYVFKQEQNFTANIDLSGSVIRLNGPGQNPYLYSPGGSTAIAELGFGARYVRFNDQSHAVSPDSNTVTLGTSSEPWGGLYSVGLVCLDPPSCNDYVQSTAGSPYFVIRGRRNDIVVFDVGTGSVVPAANHSSHLGSAGLTWVDATIDRVNALESVYTPFVDAGTVNLSDRLSFGPQMYLNHSGSWWQFNGGTPVRTDMYFVGQDSNNAFYAQYDGVFGAANTVRLRPEAVDDGGVQVAVIADTLNTWATSGSKLQSWRNHGVEKASVSLTGAISAYTADLTGSLSCSGIGGNNTTSSFSIYSARSAASTSSSSAAIELYDPNALDTNDLVVSVLGASGANVATIDYEGDLVCNSVTTTSPVVAPNTPKAAALFVGTAGSCTGGGGGNQCTPLDVLNVSTITRNSTGRYTVVLASALSDSEYNVQVTLLTGDRFHRVTITDSSTFAIECDDSSTNPIDCNASFVVWDFQ